MANAKPGQADLVDNQLTLNPAVPRNVGVRVLELTSAQFPMASPRFQPTHAAELDRVVTIMNALPRVTTLVIGHADQRRRRRLELRHLRTASHPGQVLPIASKGIDPGRLSSRVVGQSDLVSLDNDMSALALNRRTEFVFIGLLIE